MLKKLFYGSALILMLALASHFSAQSAKAQRGTIAALETAPSKGTRETFDRIEEYLLAEPPMTNAAFYDVLPQWGFVAQGGYWTLTDTAGRVVVTKVATSLVVIFRPRGDVQVAPAIIAGLIQKSAATTLTGPDGLSIDVGQRSEVSTCLGKARLSRGMYFNLSSGLWTGTYFELTLPN